MNRRQRDELWTYAPACYSVPVVRGSPNPRYFGLPLRLKQSRERAGWTRQELAQKAGGSHATIGYLESGDRWPSVGTALRLAVALSVSAAWLAYGIGEPDAACPLSAIEGMGERLQAARTERGYTKATLATEAALNPGSILGIERGGQAGLDTVEALAKALRVSPAWLAFGVGPRELPPRRRSRSTGLSSARA